MSQKYDIIVFGGGISGLFTANRLLREGYNVILIEKEALGSGQTLASQGMIHGGQKYALGGRITQEAKAAADMPARWEACLSGAGEVDLSAALALSETQIMFPAGSLFSALATFAAAKLVNGKTKFVRRPALLARGPAFALEEKVLDVKSLLDALAEPLAGRLFKGEASELLPDGQVAVNGKAFRAQALVFAAGAGNESALRLMNVGAPHAQLRPLRQIMVRGMQEPFFGHGVTAAPKPRVTITSHPDGSGEYVWYLGGNIAEHGAGVSEDDAIAFAKAEMEELFPALGWKDKEWASLKVDRAEYLDSGPLPALHQRGRVLLAWPGKLTFAPLLADHVVAWLDRGGITPAGKKASPPELPQAQMGVYPWEAAAWKKF